MPAPNVGSNRIGLRTISAHNNDEALAAEPSGMCVCERTGAGLLPPPPSFVIKARRARRLYS